MKEKVRTMKLILQGMSLATVIFSAGWFIGAYMMVGEQYRKEKTKHEQHIYQ